jgi:hypothetical protein
VAKVVVGLVEPVFAGRGEDVEVEGILKSPGFVRHIRRDRENFAGAHHNLFPIDGEFQRAFENISKLLVVVMVQRNVAVLFDEDAREHDLLAVNHLAVDVRIQPLALNVFP